MGGLLFCLEKYFCQNLSARLKNFRFIVVVKVDVVVVVEKGAMRMRPLINHFKRKNVSTVSWVTQCAQMLEYIVAQTPQIVAQNVDSAFAFQNSPKVTKYLGFFNKICWQNFQKIAQSGHADPDYIHKEKWHEKELFNIHFWFANCVIRFDCKDHNHQMEPFHWYLWSIFLHRSFAVSISTTHKNERML